MSEKIYYSVNGVRKEAKGEKLNYILQAQKEMQEAERLLEAEQQAKQATLDSAIAKLAKLGLTEDEAKAIVGIQ